mmetsp:Transcript_52138/g.108585  ORF Transcript_52138/g.108585 Transcript_52138/m.108585 type:complete len:207 (+) Transcript_52138:86-706(+)
MPQPLKCGLTSTVAQPLDSVWDQETRRANEANHQTTTKSLHNCTPARYSRSSGPARFSTTRKNKQFENPLRKEPVARAPCAQFLSAACIAGLMTSIALFAYIIGTTTQTRLEPMKAHHQWIDLGPSVWVHFQPLPLIQFIHPGTSSSDQKTTVPKAWRALTTSCTGYLYHALSRIPFNHMQHKAPSMIPAGTSTAKTTLSMLALVP